MSLLISVSLFVVSLGDTISLRPELASFMPSPWKRSSSTSRDLCPSIYCLYHLIPDIFFREPTSLRRHLLLPARFLLVVVRVVLFVANISIWLTGCSVNPFSSMADNYRLSMYPSRRSNVPYVPWFMSMLFGSQVAAFLLPPAKGPPSPDACIWLSRWLSA